MTAAALLTGENPVGKTVRQPPFPGRSGSTHEVVGYVQDDAVLGELE